MLQINSKLLLKLIQSRHHMQNQGFTMVEVLVGLLLTVVFMGVSMQAMVSATAIRVRAQESSESANWVKADLTIITDQAKALGGYNSTAGTYSSLDTSRCAATTASTGYAALLQSTADNNSDTTGADSTIGAEDTDPKRSSIGNREYTLRRRTSSTASAPQVLRVQYDVYRGTGTATTPIYSNYSEVIPGAALACKQL
jgi:Tfp pilus assembly protein PilW